MDEFKGNSETGKYQCIHTDPQHRKVLDILPCREEHYLSSYFSSFSKKKRAKVKVVVIDRFHYIRQVLWAFDKVRRQEQHKFAKDRRRYFKQSKKLL